MRGDALALARRGRAGRTLFALALVGPATGFVTLYLIIPLALIFSRSFTDADQLFGNYRQLWESILVRRAAQASLALSIWTTIVCVAVGYAVAYRLSLMRPRTAHLLLLTATFPIWTAVLARLYAWTIVLGRRGPINDWMVKSGVIDAPLELVFTRASAILGLVHILLPYMILIAYSTISRVDRTLLDASRSLGAGWFQSFRHVLLPLTLPGAFAGGLLVFILSLGNVVTPLVLGGPKERTIPVHIIESPTAGSALAAGSMLLLVTMALFFLFNRLFGVSRLLTGSVRR